MKSRKELIPLSLVPFASTKKVAFTLAEVLITLGIIGIVAAMTIPNLISKWTEAQTVSKVKKFYSTLTQGFMLVREEYGDVDAWDLGGVANTNPEGVTKFAEHIKTAFKISVDCGTETCDLYLPSEKIKYLRGVEWNSNYTSATYYKLVLSDGSFLWMRINRRSAGSQGNCEDADGPTDNVCAAVWYDVNGKAKPNTLGKDIFQFHVLSESVIPNQTDDCYTLRDGWGCAKFILQNGNMKYPKTRTP